MVKPIRTGSADSAGGTIVVLDAQDGVELGTVAGFAGPVTGLAWTDEGGLLVKTNGGPGRHRRSSGYQRACVAAVGQILPRVTRPGDHQVHQ